MLEGQMPRRHRIQRHPHCPDIRLHAVVPAPLQHLRRRVAGRPAGSLQHGVLAELPAQAEIDQLQVLAIDHDVLGFDIAMADTDGMQVLYCV